MSINELRRRPTSSWIEQMRARYPLERTVDVALTAKMRRRSEASQGELTDLAELRAKLEAFLARRIDGPFALKHLSPLVGGASKEQFVFELDWTCEGERRIGERMVLRKEPTESVVETHRLREFQLVRAAAGVVPVPHFYWLDEHGSEFGRPAIVCGFVDGVQKPVTVSDNVTGIGISFDEAHRAALGPQLVDCLARIHNLDTRGADLSAFDFPRIGASDDIDWQINWCARSWQEDMLEPVPLMTVAEQWLRDHRYPLENMSLIHGDFRTGNFLFDPASKQITAILDWELGFFGDRHFDLAWLMMPIFTTPDEHGRPLVSSLFEGEAFISSYEDASGMAVDLERLHYYGVFCRWRSVTHTLGSALRAADGMRSHHDILLAWFAALGYPLLKDLSESLAVVIDGVKPPVISGN